MPYPDKVLANDEEVVEHLHPHWITLVPATLWLIVFCGVGGVCIGFAPSGHPWHMVVIVAVIVVGVILLIWRSLAPLLEWWTTHYVFTTHRVLIRRGVLRHTGHDIALQRISDVGFSQSLWDRIVKAGTVTIESAGEHGEERLANVPRSEQQQQLLNRLIEQDGQRRGYGQGGPTGGYATPPRTVGPNDPDDRGGYGPGGYQGGGQGSGGYEGGGYEGGGYQGGGYQGGGYQRGGQGSGGYEGGGYEGGGYEGGGYQRGGQGSGGYEGGGYEGGGQGSGGYQGGQQGPLPPGYPTRHLPDPPPDR